MISVITASSVKKNVQKFGFKTFDEKLVDLMNSALQAFLENKLKKAAKLAKGAAIDQQHVAQSGGRVLMPSEYFGVPTNHYVETLSSNGVDMTVNNMWIRPPMDLMGPIASGGSQQTFTISFAKFKEMCSHVTKSLTQDTKVTTNAQKALYDEFSRKMGLVLHNTSRKVKSDHVSVHHVKEVLSLKKFSVFKKN